MFTFEHATFRYQPYPIGLVKPILAPDLYQDFLDAFPPREMFEHIPRFGSKYSLSEKFNRKSYYDFIAAHPRWQAFHAWIKNPAFIESVEEMLLGQGIDLGLQQYKFVGTKKYRRRLKDLARGRPQRHQKQLSARFEFSMLPADGGVVHAHTDNPLKIITLIVSMVKAGEWPAEFGGGTDINRAKDPRKSYNWLIIIRFYCFKGAELEHSL